MTAQVSRSLEQPKNKIHTGNSDILMTKDLLGNLCKPKADLDFKAGGKIDAKLSDGEGKTPLMNFLADSKLQDLNFPPHNLFDEMPTSLDLKLQSCSTPSLYQSVCTLDKVKYALERAEKETIKKRSSSLPPPPSSPPPPPSTTTPRMFAAACPGCFLYVIASTTNPRCPRCNSFVPSSLPMKKPRLDLNASF